ncbi:MAG: NADH-quinone oxidoreductase subunit J [Roseibacillus sp.]|nr:NADH-quinone oxidoreductase subunit J [Roseibacillus sp.]
MPFFFYSFAALAVIGAISLICFRNPVSSAMSMVASFVGLAALFIGLNAYFVGIIQILVYAGAIMVLFLFIIMLLDLKAGARPQRIKPLFWVSGVVIPLAFIVQLCAILPQVPNKDPERLALKEAASSFYDPDRKPDEQSEIYRSLKNGALPDVHLIGLTMFGHKGDNPTIKTPGYNFPLQIIGVLLLVATVGVVALSLKKKDSLSKDTEP